MNLGGRVKLAREKRGLDQGPLAELVGTSQANISALETRDSTKSELLFALADALRVNPRWLQTGEPANDTGLETDAGWQPAIVELRSDERKLLELYNELPEEGRPAIHEVAETTLGLIHKLAVRQTPTRKLR